MKMERMKVKHVFYMKDKHQVYATLDVNTDVSFKSLRPNYLVLGEKKIDVGFASMGNIKGDLVVALNLKDIGHSEITNTANMYIE